jgi:hypothetical protein
MRNYQKESDPENNPQFRRRWRHPATLSPAEQRLEALRRKYGPLEAARIARRNAAETP